MKFYALSHHSSSEVLRIARERRAGERAGTAETLAAICEVEARKLYLEAGYPSLFDYCVQDLGYSRDAAWKRIHATHAARAHADAVFPALADGRLHLSALLLLAAHLTPANARELVAAAAHASKTEIEEMLARRLPKPDLPPVVRALPVPQQAPGPVENIGVFANLEPAPAQPAPAGLVMAVAVDVQQSRTTPLAPARYGYQFSNDDEFQADVTEAFELLGSTVAPGDLAQLFKRVLKAALPVLRKRKFGDTEKPRRCRSPKPGSRTIPKSVQRAVWKRDGGQCTFVSPDGRRCSSRRVQFDHVEAVARGGQSTVSNLRLLCHAHNQYAAERTFGAGFMEKKREERRLTDKEAGEARARAIAATAAVAAMVAARVRAEEVTPSLRSLGFKATEVRDAVQHCATLPDGRLEDRVKAAIRFLRPKKT